MNYRVAPTAPILDIAIPVYNEERVLEQSVRTLHAHVHAQIPFATSITLVDNASTDGTRLIGMRLACELDGVRFVHLPEKGRGLALRAAWMASDAHVLAYMDVDLFRDAQCGFKAIRAQVAHDLVPMVRDQGWFFDTELLVVAQRAGVRIHEVPVHWVEDPDSRVNIPRTVLTDLRGVLRLLRDTPPARAGLRTQTAQPQEVR
jgi:glycosyltransferase involved in cell wall biosynthesis